MNIEATLQEIRDRAIRTESRVVKLGEAMGVDLRTTQNIRVVGKASNALPARVEIDSLDVSVSRILATLTAAKSPASAAHVYHNDLLVFTVYRSPLNQPGAITHG